MPRRNDARNKNSYYSSTSYPPSPPPQLPTPLPDEHLPMMSHSALYLSRLEEPGVLSPLIDFDTPTPPQPIVSLPAETSLVLGSDIDNDIAIGRSPPFREAPLPQDSPPPLPIRPRVAHWTDQEYQRSMEDTLVTDDRSFVGHSRAPNISRPGTRTSSTPVSPIFASSSGSASTLENLTRTIRGYVHSSIPIPTSPSSPPSNSRVVAIGISSRSPPRQDRATQQEFERDYELDNEEGNEYYGNCNKPQLHAGRHSEFEVPSSMQPMGSSGLAQAMQRNIDADPKPPSDQAETIIWARWDILHTRRLLIVGYFCGLQVWDCTNLSSVDEVLNVNLDSDEWRMLIESEDSGSNVRVVHAAVVPSPGHQSVHYGDIDPYIAQRPLLGILLESALEGKPEQAIFFIYSVHKHQVVKRLNLPGAPSTFVSNEQFTVISTTNPPILHILSSTTFQTLQEISSASLELSISQASFISHAINAHLSPTSPPVSTPNSNPRDEDTSIFSNSSSPVPVFALSHRLLAYASPSPSATLSGSQEPLNIKDIRRFSSSTNASVPSGQESSVSSSPFGFGPGQQIAAIDVGHAALKVGETVFNGMKYFGGIALEAAKNRVGSGQSFGVGIRNQRPNSGRDNSNGGKFVSRSAPDHLTVRDETEPKLRRSSSTLIGDPHGHPTRVAPSTKPGRERGYYVTVVDLAPLCNQHEVTRIDEIRVSTSQPAVKIEFSADGTSIGVALRDGHSMKVFKLKSSPDVTSSKDKADEGGEVEYQRSTATQIYNLYRGRTSAVVECIVWAKDGRYIGCGTMNRTIHIYAVNPYGGKSNLRSHLEGRVRNVETVDHSTTTLTPIARLRGSRTESQAALALTFVSDAELVVAPHLLPPSSPNHTTLSPFGGKLGTNYQHILLFDPEDGVLSLHRLTLEKSPPRDAIMGGVAASIQALGVTSMSLPGGSNLGRLSTSPSAKPVTSTKTPESPMELAAKVNRVATYNLRRGRDWGEVTKPLETPGSRKQSSHSGDWLAEAELSTCSSSHRSIYLSHQFSFHTLGEDYHALIRGYQLHVSGNKIDVRKEVEIRTSAWNITTFAEGFSSALDTQRDPSSFDEPISSAISGSFDNSNIPHILPMYPNGLPGANVKSLRNSIPIRAISGFGDGVSEGFGRIRKEMHRVRPPTVAPRSDISSVPLEFDEEEFLEQHGEMLHISGVGPTSSHILSSNNITQKFLDSDVVGTVDEELFNGWDVDDKQAIDEVEQFQDIAVAGYLVEEEEKRQQDERKIHAKRSR